MITPEKIDEWIQEAEERPWSAALLIRHIANRLNEVSQWNEELQAENIALRSDKKVEDFERQINALEYQLGLLKRQLSGLGSDALVNLPELLAQAETLNLLLYTPQGQVLRIQLNPEKLESGQVLARLPADAANSFVRMLVASSTEEILFAFDTGRVVTLPLDEIPPAGPASTGEIRLDWEKAYIQLPVGNEELMFLLPIARLPMYDSIVQISRKACVKKIKETLFKGYVTKSYIGSGVKANVDRMFTLALCQPDDSLVLVSKEGFLSRLAVSALPITIEESLRLGITDHLVAAFPVGEKPSLLVVTNNGKAIHREQNWLEVGNLKSKGYAAFSEARRRSGIEVVGAAAVAENDWAALLAADGRIIIMRIATIFKQGSILQNEETKITTLTTW